ncbi:transcriptional regulator, MarR family [Desulfofarcimen acetoxidans DSM 771]|uniref:Transcriptional regulator, MarR family n=1 Tax=Desulfofarcimen acetoxidans (strain ATCC 49208 / DSM 771 / KCTC 5769 / VKM B-1644 / 5575) TaxID=485916 RepID=C8W531_DESAS|nr:MarR family transcriptional regulator [Desulfofarcimen acetoxidans]ACV61383.1 transcriptional regulator, MarR family [Desulfofarcimen acetoxidans DSM 771]
MKAIEELTDELLLFFNGFASWESSVIRSSDLTVSEAHAIEVLGQYGKMNMKNLAQKLGVTTGTTTVTVDRLEKKDYAKRETTREDRRVNLISLTEKGMRAFAEHHNFHLNLTEQMVSNLSEEEIEQFHKILKKINAETF